MVIFNSYVKLPEGKITEFLWSPNKLLVWEFRDGIYRLNRHCGTTDLPQFEGQQADNALPKNVSTGFLNNPFLDNYNSPRKFEHFGIFWDTPVTPFFSPCYLATWRTTAKWLLPPVACQHRGAHSDHVAAQILGAKMLQKVQGPLPPPTGHGPCIGRPGEIYLGKSYIVIIYVIWCHINLYVYMNIIYLGKWYIIIH